MGIYSQCFIIVFSAVVCFKFFYDDALTELGSHYANRTLIVSGTREYT